MKSISGVTELATRRSLNSALRFKQVAVLLLFTALSACGSGGDETAAGDQGATTTINGSGSAANVRTKAPGTLAEQAARAQWSAPVATPILPVSAAHLPDGRVLMWSAEDRFGFTFAVDGGRTYSMFYDPTNGQMSERLVTETGHDMFCPGTTNLADGRLLVNGGLSSGKTSLFDASTNTWSTAAPMNIPRGYNANTLLADGSVLTLGGSWDGGIGNKHGEVWSAANGWRRLAGVPIDPMLSNDPVSSFGMDSHLWMIPTGNGQVLHAGPGRQMNWIDTRGQGKVRPAGARGDDAFSINGNAVMYDTGKILKVGGMSGYSGVPANSNSFVIEVANGTAGARRIASMAYTRGYQNSVVLPNGQVIVIGGQTFPINFSDSNSVLAPELFDPATETFTLLPPLSVARNYHSVALLLPDARVLSAGGGLCGQGCAANHADFQILSPPYLFNADGSAASRPTIISAPRTAAYGTTVNVTTDSAIESFSIVRLSSNTHAVNNDQRRLSLSFRANAANGANSYDIEVPSNPGWALPGEYMLFAMNFDGTPSVSRPVRIGAANGLWLTPPDELFGTVGTPLEVNLNATSNGGGSLSYGATGLPDGMTIDTGTGRISGVPTRAASYNVTIMARNGDQTVSWQVPWNIGDAGNVAFVRFEALGEVNGNPWTSMAEFDLFDEQGRILPRSNWTVSADSTETAAINGLATNVIDGNPGTIWHSAYQGASSAYPHQLTISLGGTARIGGFRYTPRSGSTVGTVADYRFYLSSDGYNWGAPFASGDLRTLGPNEQSKSVYLGNLIPGKATNQSSTAMNGATIAERATDGNIDGTLANGSTSQTAAEPTPWWEVDLGSNHTLHTLRIWNRTDCCAEQLRDFYVLLSPTPMNGRTLAALLADPAVKNIATTGVAGRLTDLNNAGSGQYLRVQLAGAGSLQLAEVQAYGYPSQNRAPTIATPAPANARVGLNTSLQLSGLDPDGDNLVWSANGLPAGLTLEPSRGLISGQPSAPGNYNIQLSVSDARGGNASASFGWTVLVQELSVAPVAAPAVQNGSNASYSAVATGSGLQYRWNFGDGSAETNYLNSPNVTHAYQAPGIYNVTLSVRDLTGAVSTRSFMQAVAAASPSGRAIASSNLAFETRAGTGRLWVANTDNNSVSVFDAASNARLSEIPVGEKPRALALAPNGQLWVTNQDSASISVIDTTALAVVQTIMLPTGSQPFGLVIGADGNAYVALQATGRLLKVTATGILIADTALPGARHLTLSPDASRLLAPRYITAAQPGEATATIQTSANGTFAGAEVIEFDPASLAQRRRFVLRHSDRADSNVGGRGVPNYLGAAAISPDGRSAWVPSKQDNIQRGSIRDGLNLDFQNTVRAVSSRLDLASGTEDYAGRIDHDNASVASAALYHSNGAYLFVTLETSRQVAVIDAQGRRELFRIDVGRAPQGISLSNDGRRLYVHNYMDRNLTVLDLTALVDYGLMQITQLASPATVGNERLSAAVLRGKQLFYDARDPRLARDSYLSCASCHNDGGHDGRTWDLSGFGEGLRNTTSLMGRGATGHGQLHWSGNFDEVQDFEGQIRTLSGGIGLMPDSQFNAGSRREPLGDRKAGISTDLDALAAYVNSLVTVAPSPFRPTNRSLSSPAAAGKALFQSLNCASCHGGAQFTNSGNASQLKNIGTIKPSSGQRLGAALTGIDVPTLRDVWATAPYLHDGSAASISDAIRAHNQFALTENDLGNLAAYTREIGSEEPAPVTSAVPAGIACANQNAVCTIPVGATATVIYQAGGVFISRTGVSGTLNCSNETFGDPMVGTAKTCSYSITSTAGTGSGNGSGSGSAAGGTASGATSTSSGSNASAATNGNSSGTSQTTSNLASPGGDSIVSVSSSGNADLELRVGFAESSGRTGIVLLHRSASERTMPL